MCMSQSFFQNSSPKLTFVFGLVAGVAIASIVGFGGIIIYISKNGSFAFNKSGNGAGDVVAQGNQQPSDSAGQQGPVNLAEVSKDDWVRGNKKADIALVEYSDYQCPFCESFHQTMQQVMKEYGTKVKWVLRHFPLDSIHPNARPAAIAAECVGKQKGNDAFWKFTDAMFANQSTLGKDLFVQEATKLGANKARYVACLEKKETEKVVNDDYETGITAGVEGTPGNFVIVSGKDPIKLRGAEPFENMKQLLDSLLK